MSELKYLIKSDDDGITVQQYLRQMGFSRGLLTKLKQQEGGLLCNGRHIRTVDTLCCGDTLEVNICDNSELIPNSGLNVPIEYEDNEIVIFNKPPFMAVHPSVRHYNDTLANYFSALYPNIAFRCVNRLDRNTSGLVITAKNRPAASLLTGGECRPKKTYYALVQGDLSSDYGCCGEIIAPVARISDSIITREVRSDGKYAHTVFKVIESSRQHSLVEIALVTGRTHQIRVHFSHIGHPLLGDELYGGDISLINRQALHCGRAEFIHPVMRKKIIVNSPLPDDMRVLVQNPAIQI